MKPTLLLIATLLLVPIAQAATVQWSVPTELAPINYFKKGVATTVSDTTANLSVTYNLLDTVESMDKQGFFLQKRPTGSSGTITIVGYSYRYRCRYCRRTWCAAPPRRRRQRRQCRCAPIRRLEQCGAGCAVAWCPRLRREPVAQARCAGTAGSSLRRFDMRRPICYCFALYE